MKDEIERAEVAAAALQLATDEAASAMTRMSAIQVCAGLGMKEALPVAIELAQNDSRIPLRIAAIAAVGDLGGAGQQPLLQQLASDEEQRLQVAAESAMQRIQNCTGVFKEEGRATR
jgi:HEAT repeat protein